MVACRSSFASTRTAGELREAADMVAHVHVADSSRLEPGTGHTDFAAAFGAYLRERTGADWMLGGGFMNMDDRDVWRVITVLARCAGARALLLGLALRIVLHFAGERVRLAMGVSLCLVCQEHMPRRDEGPKKAAPDAPGPLAFDRLWALARELGINEGTVKSHSSRGLAALEAVLTRQ